MEAYRSTLKCFPAGYLSLEILAYGRAAPRLNLWWHLQGLGTQSGPSSDTLGCSAHKPLTYEATPWQRKRCPFKQVDPSHCCYHKDSVLLTSKCKDQAAIRNSGSRPIGCLYILQNLRCIGA